MKTLCFGSLNLDNTYEIPHFVRAGETLQSTAVRLAPGGKGFNQTVAFSRAGGRIEMAGNIGTDGTVLLDFLSATGVGTDRIRRLENIRTGHAIIQCTPDGQNCILLYEGANGAVTGEQIRDSLKEFEPGDLLILQNEVNMLPEIMEEALSRGMRIAFNPSPFDETLNSLPLDEMEWLIVNETEACGILGRNCPKSGTGMIRELGKRFRNRSVILTMGTQGSFCFHEDAVYEQSAFQVDTVDTTGAGDTYLGYFLFTYYSTGNIPEAMRTASAAAALAASKHGAAESIPVPEQVREFLSKGQK